MKSPAQKAYDKEYMKGYRERNREQINATQREWCRNNRQACVKHAQKSKNKQQLVAFQKLGGVCCKCGFADIRALQIDHVMGNGVVERAANGRCSYSLYSRVLKDSKNKFQLLCANCNWIKRHENQEWKPHK